MNNQWRRTRGFPRGTGRAIASHGEFRVPECPLRYHKLFNRLDLNPAISAPSGTWRSSRSSTRRSSTRTPRTSSLLTPETDKHFFDRSYRGDRAPRCSTGCPASTGSWAARCCTGAGAMVATGWATVWCSWPGRRWTSIPNPTWSPGPSAGPEPEKALLFRHGRQRDEAVRRRHRLVQAEVHPRLRIIAVFLRELAREERREGLFAGGHFLDVGKAVPGHEGENICGVRLPGF